MFSLSFLVDTKEKSTGIVSKSSDSPNKEGEDEVAEENIEGRFFIKDKLCALGLADVSIGENNYYVF